MTPDRPRALVRELLNEVALIRSGGAARGFSEAEVEVIERAWITRRLGLATRPANPARPDPEMKWIDGMWITEEDRP